MPDLQIGVQLKQVYQIMIKLCKVGIRKAEAGGPLGGTLAEISGQGA
jgi:hypothetical protein